MQHLSTNSSSSCGRLSASSPTPQPNRALKAPKAWHRPHTSTTSAVTIPLPLPLTSQQQQLTRRLGRHFTAAASAADAAAAAAAAAAAPAGQQQQQTVNVVNPEGGAPFPINLQVPVGCEVYQVALKKPLGLTLTEKPGSVIVVDDLTPVGHAQQAGIAVGDVLLAVTARAQKPGSSSPQIVLLPTQGQSFKTVAAALRSNTCAQCSIVLLLQRQRQQL